MPSTYEPIATTTLGTAAASIDFTSIPATYTDLRLVLIGTVTLASYTPLLRFNSDSASNYSYTFLQGSGTTATSGRGTSQTWIQLGPTNGFDSTIPNFLTVDIFSYAGSTNKTCLATMSEDLNGSGYTIQEVGLWRSTSAITSLTFFLQTNYQSPTRFSLYGIKGA